MDLSASTLIALCAGTTAFIVGAFGTWLSWYREAYNEDFFVARKRGTLWKFRSTQHPTITGW